MAVAALLTARYWTGRRLAALAVQALIAAAVLAVAWFAVENALANLARLKIKTGFEFLERPAGFAIAQRLIPYSESSTYFAAFLAALLNTLVLALVAIAVATPLGFALGIARRASNQLVAGAATAYVETLRNVPLLLQLFFWYFSVLRALPGPRQAVGLWDAVFLSNRGLYVPAPVLDGLRLTWDVPHLQGFNFQGGWVLIPELVAMWLALTIYGASYVAEIVRAGVLAVPAGQVEAARSLGLAQRAIYRLVVVPQALRVMIPPLTSQYVNLVKSSSLAAAIAYPDLMQIVVGTILNQTGQALEVVTATMSVYLAIGLVISAAMNASNRHVAVVGRAA